ncbi:hypothetical protein BWI17_04110 [Betaproteobacteria bacterium GR16-43]|nr:hypothetical protein BWI17_04110 [Betaproteobacteria bacterium GR16-43]
MKVHSATPVLFMKWVEPSRDWFMKVGFTVMFDVPAKNPRYLGFVGLQNNGVQVMLETRGNDNESPQIRERTLESAHAVVFIEVDDLDAVIAALAGTKVLAERHKTFYGADEISYEEPGGHIVTFAKMDR